MSNEAKEIIRDFEQSIAKAILYCVGTLPLALGIYKTIDILRGAKTTFIIERKLYEVAVYGIFRTFTTEYLHTVIEVLFEQRLLAIKMVSHYENLPTLKITSEGQDFLAGNLHREVAFVKKGSARGVISLDEEEEKLFKDLKQLRLEIAHQKGLPAYTICHDSALWEMSKAKPATADKLLAMHGIGEKFVQNYGDEFLSVIRQHVR